MTNHLSWSRRKFVAAMAGTGAAIILNPFTSWAFDDLDPRVAAIVANTIGIDTHNHIDVPINPADGPGPNIDIAGDMKRSGLSAICLTIPLDYQKFQRPGEAYERFLTAMHIYDDQLKANGMKRAFSLKDIEQAHKQRQPIVVQSIEGGHFLEGQIDRVKIAYDRGLRHITLLHDSDASTPLGDVYTNPPRFGGLTAFGADVVKECNRLGIVVDLTHCSNDTIAGVLKIATKPVMLSHTGLDTQLGQNANMARMMKPRLLSKDEAKIVADAGGIIGVWTHLADSPLEYAQNIRALVDVVGVDHVCIGTDTKLTPSYRSPNAGPSNFGPPQGQNSQGGPPQGQSPQGGPPPGGQGTPRPGERTNYAWQDQKEGFYYVVVDALLKTGFNADEIGKIGGGNFCRVFDAATKGHS